MAVLWIFVVIVALAAPAFGQSLAELNVALTPGERATSVPAIAANTGNADALVVWSEEPPRTDPRFPSPNRVVGRLFTAAGPRGDLIQVATGGATNPGATEPVVAFNSVRGEYFVVYRHGAVGVVARRLSADGLALGTETEIAAVGVDSGNLAVAYNATANEYLVIWRAVSSGITSQRVDAAGSTIGPARTLAPFPAISSSVTFNPRRAARGW